MRSLPIVTKEGFSLRLDEVAIVEDGAEDIDTVSRWNKQESVTLAINKLSDGDAISIAKRARQEIQRLSKSLSKDISLEVAYDSTERIITNTNGTLVNIAIGVVLTVIILFVFLGKGRRATMT